MPNNQQICFMRTSGLYMTEGMAEQLYLLALDMVREQERLRDFKIEDRDKQVGEGRMTTDYATVCVGHFGGITFDAIVEWETRRFEVSFILDSRYLHEFVPGYWGFSPTPCSKPTVNHGMLN